MKSNQTKWEDEMDLAEEILTDLLAGAPSVQSIPALEKRLAKINRSRAALIQHLENRAQHGEPEDLGGEQRLAGSEDLSASLDKLQQETLALTQRLEECKRLQA